MTEDIVTKILRKRGHSNPKSVGIEQLAVELFDANSNNRLADEADRLIKEGARLNQQIDDIYEKLSNIAHYKIDESTVDKSDERQRVLLKWKNDYMGNWEEIWMDWP
jgi:hypothetical protein